MKAAVYQGGLLLFRLDECVVLYQIVCLMMNTT